MRLQEAEAVLSGEASQGDCHVLPAQRSRHDLAEKRREREVIPGVDEKHLVLRLQVERFRQVRGRVQPSEAAAQHQHPPRSLAPDSHVSLGRPYIWKRGRDHG